MVLPGARTSPEQCLRQSFESLPSMGKAERIFHVPQSAKTRHRIKSADGTQQDLKVLLQNRASAQHAGGSGVDWYQ